jgi:hypothetical protein
MGWLSVEDYFLFLFGLGIETKRKPDKLASLIQNLAVSA